MPGNFLPLRFLVIIILSMMITGCVDDNLTHQTNDTDPVNTIDDPLSSKNVTLVDVNDLQEILDDADDGSIILVRSGMLQKTIYINRTVDLRGYKNNTILEVNDPLVNPACIIKNDSVHLSNITFLSTFDDESIEAPVFLTAIEIQSSECIINHLRIKSFDIGINIQGQQKNMIKDSVIQNASTGIEIWDAQDTHVKNCTISYSEQFGVFIGFDATDNQVSYCLITHCDNGVRIKSARDNTIYRNTFVSCRNPFHECCGASNNVYVLNTEHE